MADVAGGDEVEEVALKWLRDALGLPASFFGVVYDTASVSGLARAAAARESLGLDVRNLGTAGRDLPRLRVYCTDQTHSHIEKDAILLGSGARKRGQGRNRRRIQDGPGGARPRARRGSRAGLLADGRGGDVGTTSTTSVDPVAAIARVCREHRVWLHVDAAYAGPAAIVPELRWLLEGAEAADSLVVNPHKWMFVPVNLSVLYTPHELLLRRAFSLIPAYLETPESEVRNYMDYGVQLGRRFRGLKLWFVLRAYGRRRMVEIIRNQVAWAQELARWIGEAGDSKPWRRIRSRWCASPSARAASENAGALDQHNQYVVDEINRSGFAFLSTTRLKERLRFASRSATRAPRPPMCARPGTCC